MTEGPKSAQFIRILQERTGANHLLLVPNGTLALSVGSKACGLGPADEVIVPEFTFFASGSSAVLTGATPVFFDVEADTLNMGPEQVRRTITPHIRATRRCIPTASRRHGPQSNISLRGWK